MVNRIFCICFLSLLMVVTVVRADEKDPVLERYIQEALTQNPSLKAVMSRVEAYDQMIPQAGSLPDPVLGIGIANLPTNDFSLNQQEMTGKVISLQQVVPFPGKLGLGKDKASNMRDEQQAIMEDDKAMLIMKVKETYYDWAFVLASIQTMEENRALMNQIEEIALTKYKVGTGLQQDVLMVKTERAKLDNQILGMHQVELSRMARLNTLLNREATAQLEAPLELQFKPVEIPFDSVLAAIEISNPKLQANRARERAVNSDIGLARKEYYPDMGFMVEYMQRDDHPDGMERPDFLSFKAQLSLPLYWKSKQRRMVEQRRIEQRQIEEEYQGLSKDIEFQLTDLMAQSSRLLEQIDLYQNSIIPLAEQTLESNRIGYQVSKVDFQMLITSQMTLLDSQLELKQKILDYLMVWAKVEALTGRQIM
jgi:cobalt-zinc-cadmium efflux system outer membrane protein